MEKLAESPRVTKLSKSQVPVMAAELDELVAGFPGKVAWLNSEMLKTRIAHGSAGPGPAGIWANRSLRLARNSGHAAASPGRSDAGRKPATSLLCPSVTFW